MRPDSLCPKSLNRAIAELFNAKMPREESESEYRLTYELHPSYREFFEHGKEMDQCTHVRFAEQMLSMSFTTWIS